MDNYPPTNRTRLQQAISQRGRVVSLFALAVELSIPYPKASEYLRQMESSRLVEVTRVRPGVPLVIDWKGGK